MIKSTLAKRLKAMGITQRRLAEVAGYSTRAVNEALANEATMYRLLIEALEIMTPDQRRRWLDD